MSETFYVSLDAYSVSKIIDDTIAVEDIGGKLIDTYATESSKGKCIVSVYEQYYLRINNYIVLIAVIEDLQGKAKVHLTAGGGKGGLYTDYGASKSIVNKAVKALRTYKAE